jgi:hypothetical protein
MGGGVQIVEAEKGQKMKGGRWKPERRKRWPGNICGHWKGSRRIRGIC